MRTNSDDLQRHVMHLVMDYRLGIVNSQLKDIQHELKELGRDMAQHRERVKELMEAYKQTSELRNTLARQLGREVLVSS